MNRLGTLVVVAIVAFVAVGAILVTATINTPAMVADRQTKVPTIPLPEQSRKPEPEQPPPPIQQPPPPIQQPPPPIQQPPPPIQQPPPRSEAKHLEYGAKIQSLSYGHVGGATWQEVESELVLLKNMGIRYYSIHLNYDPWIRNDKDTIAIVDRAVQWIRVNNGSLHIADAGAESLSKNPISWEDFRALFKTRITDWSQRYHPEVFTTIKEPGYYFKFIKDPQNLKVEDFRSLSFELNALVKSLSPNTKTVYADNTAGFVKDDLTIDLLRVVVKDPNIDIFGLDIYGQCGVDNKTIHLDEAIKSAKDSGKVVWITEGWGTTAKGMDSCSKLSEAEIQWARSISEYALNTGIPVVEWFFTQRFLDGLQPSATYAGMRDVMLTFKNP